MEKHCVFVALCWMMITIVCCSPSVASNEHAGREYSWDHFVKRFHKRYSSESNEMEHRQNFKQNVRFIREHNKGERMGKYNYTLEVNEMADHAIIQSNVVVQRRFGYARPASEERRIFKRDLLPEDVSALPESVNWTSAGWVTPVKDQGSCGSCWAFAAVGTLEAMHYNSTGKLISLSEQNLVDCAPFEDGCGGSYCKTAYEYVQKFGLETNASYPYNSYTHEMSNPHASKCRIKRHSHRKRIKIDGWKYVDHGKELNLRHAVATYGPIAVALDAMSIDFLFYKDGVFSSPSCSRRLLNHAVLLVGYGIHDDQPYWLIKNSWGTDWGIEGYMMIARDRDNMCGIASNAVFPIGEVLET